MRTIRSLEVVGLAVEVIGLVTLLLAALSQVSGTDWFDALPGESQYVIQGTANLAILQAIVKSARAMDDRDPERRHTYSNEVDDLASKAISRLIGDRMEAAVILRSQAPWPKLVRHAVFLLGAALVIVGQLLVLRHKSLRASAA